MVDEIWKPIKNYENYEISNYGNVRSNNYRSHNKLLKRVIANTGYYVVGLYKNGNGKQFFVHRLVAEAFIPNNNNLETVNHIDENKLNNYVDNLEWCSRGENAYKYNINRPFSKEHKEKISKSIYKHWEKRYARKKEGVLS